MATRMQQRRGTAQQWTDANPILAAGEIGFESGTNKFKIGDGVNTWSALTYYASASEIAALVDGAPDLLNTLSELSAAIGDDANFGTTIENSINTSVDEANTFTTTAVSNHRQLTQAVHGIDDTSLLALKTETTAAIAAANTYTDSTASTTLTAAATSAAADAATKVEAALVTAATDATTKADGAIVTAAADALAKANAAEANAALDATAKADAAVTSANTYTDGSITTANTYTDSSITTHNSDTTNVHGIVDTADLALTATVATDIAAAVTAHNDDTTNVHGIADTALLSTKVYADGAVTTHNSDTTDVHGIADTAQLALLSDVSAVTATTLGLGNVDNTSDADKPVSTATVTAIATAKSEAIAEVTAVIDGAPGALDTLNELAAALGDDANFAGTVTTSLAAKVDSYTPITQKTESYTLSTLDHRDDLIEMGSASALTLTIPLNSSIAYPVGTSLDILQTGAGQVTIAGAGGVTVNATPGLKLRTQWSSCTLFKRAEDTWVVYGDLTA
jgi:hypothetical protein